MKSNARLLPVALAAALLLAAACGGGGGRGSSTTPSAPTSPTIPVSGACAALGQTVSASTAIVNGADCSAANSPVVLLNLKDSGGQQVGSCSGTVIAPRAILTAAHCLPATAASVKVFLGAGAELMAQSFARVSDLQRERRDDARRRRRADGGRHRPHAGAARCSAATRGSAKTPPSRAGGKTRSPASPPRSAPAWPPSPP